MSFYSCEYIYCCPSGFNELRPALNISSVDSRLTAMTELRLDIKNRAIIRFKDLIHTLNEASAA